MYRLENPHFRVPPFSFLVGRSPLAESSLKTGSLGPGPRMGPRLRQALGVGHKGFLSEPPRRPPPHGPAQNRWPSLVPGTYLGSTASDRRVPALVAARPEPRRLMGNCLHRVSAGWGRGGGNPRPHLGPPAVGLCSSSLLPLPSSSSPGPLSQVPRHCPHLLVRSIQFPLTVPHPRPLLPGLCVSLPTCRFLPILFP